MTQEQTEKLHKGLKKMSNRKTKGEFKHPSKRTINCIGFEAAYSSPEAQEHLAKQRKEIEDFNKHNQWLHSPKCLNVSNHSTL